MSRQRQGQPSRFIRGVDLRVGRLAEAFRTGRYPQDEGESHDVYENKGRILVSFGESHDVYENM